MRFYTGPLVLFQHCRNPGYYSSGAVIFPLLLPQGEGVSDGFPPFCWRGGLFSCYFRPRLFSGCFFFSTLSVCRLNCADRPNKIFRCPGVRWGLGTVQQALPFPRAGSFRPVFATPDVFALVPGRPPFGSAVLRSCEITVLVDPPPPTHDTTDSSQRRLGGDTPPKV